MSNHDDDRSQESAGLDSLLLASRRPERPLELQPELLTDYLEGRADAASAASVREALAESAELRDIALQLSGLRTSTVHERQRYDERAPTWPSWWMRPESDHSRPAAPVLASRRMRRWLWRPAVGYGIAAALAVLLVLPRADHPAGSSMRSLELRAFAPGDELRDSFGAPPLPFVESASTIESLCLTLWLPESLASTPLDGAELTVSNDRGQLLRRPLAALMENSDGVPVVRFCLSHPRPGAVRAQAVRGQTVLFTASFEIRD